MGVHRFHLESAVPRRWVWAALTDVEGIARWSGFDRCLAEGTGRLTDTTEMRCSVVIGKRRHGARLQVVDAREPEHLALETVATLATMTEDLVLTPNGQGGTTVDYTLSATSSAFGPAVTLWVDRHLDSVRTGLAEMFGSSAAVAPADDPASGTP